MPIDLRDQYFGTEIEMTGITRQRAAQVVAEMFGTDYYHRISYDSWCVRDQQGKEWKFSRDGSIITERKVGGLKTYADEAFATEMVSPKLEYSEMGKLQEVVRCLRQEFLRPACPCGCFQAYAEKPEERHDNHVFERGYPVQSIESTDLQGTGLLPEGAPCRAGKDPEDAKQHDYNGKV